MDFVQRTDCEDMNIAIVGHVDHGKSTVIGRLLVDTNSLALGKLEQIQEKCRRNSKPFEYAFLLDALKDEQEQGITIDSARCFFKTQKRNYIIIDAPGHIELLKNMVTGASRAEAALLVIDAFEGIQENTKRHGYLLSMLGVKQLCVLVNKMDLINYDEKVYRSITEAFKDFLAKIGLEALMFIPISGYYGENIVQESENMTWYKGNTVLEALERFKTEKLPEDKAFRMPIQGVYKFTAGNDTRRIIAGTVETGLLKVNDEVIFFPSGKKSRVKSIEVFNEETKTSVCAGYSTGFTLTEQIYLKRGEIVAVSGEQKPQIATRIKVKLFWLGKQPMEKSKTYFLKLGTAKVKVWIEEIIRVFDTSTLQNTEFDYIKTNDVAECVLSLERPIAFDLEKDNFYLSRFVIVDNYEISGGGIINEALKQTKGRVSEFSENKVIKEERIIKYKQKPVLLVITGLKNTDLNTVAKALERKFFDDGKLIYYVEKANLFNSINGDMKLVPYPREKYFKGLGEACKIALDAGNILIITAAEMSNNDLKALGTVIDPEKIKVVCLGNMIESDISYDLHINEDYDGEDAIFNIEAMLVKDDIIS